MTLEESRRKSGRDMEFNRQQSGRDMEFNRQQSGRDMERNRQQSGRNMEEARRASGRKMREDMNALAESNRQARSLPVLASRGGEVARRGRADWAAPSLPSGSGGIASPITEPLFASREYYESGTRSSDGLFFIPAVKKIVMTDANGDPVIFQYAAQA